MSLVSEALKKAQREAARREGQDKGLPEPLVAGAQPWRARRASRTPLAIALAAGAIVLVGGALYFASDAGNEGLRDERRPVKKAAPAVADEVGPAAPAQPVASEPSSPAASPIEVDGLRAAPADGPTVEGPGSAATPTAPPASDPAPSAPAAAPTRAATPLPAPATRETTFVRSARLASGTEVRLGGIAWSETAPLAYLNGKLLGVGESSGSARVERIARDRVVLATPEGRIVITLR
ncbi:MAG: hypothetical protein AMXMBFR36_16580 [Acidobacteriota bacterium]